MAVQYAPQELPGGMIGLHTLVGRQMQEEASVINDLMINRFKNQVNRKYCGLASLSLLINSINIAYRIKLMTLTDKSEQDKLLERVQAGETITVDENDIARIMKLKKDIMVPNNLDKAGLTLPQLFDVAMHLGLGGSTYYAYKNQLEIGENKRKLFLQNVDKDSTVFLFKSEDEFREFAKDFIGRIVTGLIINYDMSKLGYKGLTGHFSPLAAYHEERDMFLVMDVWPDTPPAWVFTKDLFNAMSTVDGDSGLPRGLLYLHELLF